MIRTTNQTTHFVGDWYEQNVTTGIATCYYPFNGQAIACKQGTSLFYLHHDQVGSLVSLTDASAREVAALRFWPFGSLRTLTFANGYTTLPTDRLFTGQTRDLGEDRSYYFKSRYYDATIGKFQSPDSIVPKADNPQALNRYAYGLNSPLRYVDPTGHLSQDQIDGYLQQTYGNQWQTYLQQWQANQNWWAAISAAQPGDYIGANGRFGRLSASGNGISILTNDGRTNESLDSWAGRDPSVVLHEVRPSLWHVAWAKATSPDTTGADLDNVSAALTTDAGWAAANAALWRGNRFFGSEVSSFFGNIAFALGAASVVVGGAGLIYTGIHGGVLNVDGNTFISVAEIPGAVSTLAGALGAAGLVSVPWSAQLGGAYGQVGLDSGVPLDPSQYFWSPGSE